MAARRRRRADERRESKNGDWRFRRPIDGFFFGNEWPRSPKTKQNKTNKQTKTNSKRRNAAIPRAVRSMNRETTPVRLSYPCRLS